MSDQHSEITRSPGDFRGAFGGYAVYGTLFRDQSGKEFWLLNLTRAWSEDRGSSDRYYWVSETEFRRCLGGELTSSTYLLAEVVTDLEPDERQAAMDAIGRWERSPAAA